MKKKIKIISQNNILSEALNSFGQYEISEDTPFKLDDREKQIFVNGKAISKPVILKKLIELIESSFTPEEISLKNLRFNPIHRRISANDQHAQLTEKEVQILLCIYNSPKHQASKSKILEKIWGFSNGVESTTLETHVYRLRQKFAKLTKEQIFRTLDDQYFLDL